MKVTLTWIRRAAVMAVAVLALVPVVGPPAAAGQENPPPTAGLPPLPPPVLPLVTNQDLLDGLKHPTRWLTYSGDYSGRRHSPLKQITVDNVNRLAAQWTFQAEGMVIGRGFESTPLVMDGVLYITGNNNVAWAIDARTGRQIWRYRRALPPGLTYGAGNPSNRGFAALGDRLFMSTLDGHLLAFDRNSGRIVWDTLVDDYKAGHALIAAPLVVKDKVVVGNSGGDLPTRGFIDAYDPRSGARLWRFHTIPGPGEPGSETWSDSDVLPRGGGAAWVTGSYDPDLNLIYWGTGNPNPDYFGGDRQGNNLFTASLVALDADTGRLKWHYQFTPHDLHDWDAEQTPMLIDAPFGGAAERHLLVQANRNGFLYVLDRTDGRLLLAKPFVDKLTWASGIGADGRPQMLPGAEPTAEGARVCPSVEGATNWFSTAFHPGTGLFYVMALEKCNIYTKSPAVWKAGESYYGGTTRRVPGEVAKKYLRALDPRTGRRVWEVPQEGPGATWGGVLSTAGGVVFYGDDTGNFAAVDAANGHPLWRWAANASWKASPMTYLASGLQYVAIAAGPNILSFALPQD